MSESFLFLAFVYLGAAVLAVPIAKRLGLGSVLGYLLAGVAIGPFALGFVGENHHDVLHFAEFGVVMMLFLVGLELRPAMLWELRRPILGLGGLQVVITTLVAAGGGIVLGLPTPIAIAIGTILAMSSTAIVLSSLTERGLIKSNGGQAGFSVLLFQDIAVIPILAIFPLLAGSASDAGGAHAAEPSRPGWMQALLVIGAVGGVVVAGRFALGPAFRWLAKTRLREIFTAAALLVVVGIALLMEKVGLRRRSARSSPVSSSRRASTATRSRATSSRSRACSSGCSSSRSARRSIFTSSRRGRFRSRGSSSRSSR